MKKEKKIFIGVLILILVLTIALMFMILEPVVTTLGSDFGPFLLLAVVILAITYKVKGLTVKKIKDEINIFINKEVEVFVKEREISTKEIEDKNNIIKEVKTKNIEIKKDINYWLLIVTPDKLYGDKVLKNAEVNNFLLNIENDSIPIGKKVLNIKSGDYGVIKVGNDTRSKSRRILNKQEQDKLESGIYAIVEFIDVDNNVVFQEGDISKVNFKIINNLFKNKNIISKEKAGEDFKSNINKQIDKKVFDKI